MQKVITEIQEYIQVHYAEHITLDVLAEIFYINKFHLQKKFKEFVGLTPGQYTMQVRIGQAKELLLTTDIPVHGIAFEVGIRNVSYFISLFSRMEKCLLGNGEEKMAFVPINRDENYWE